MSGAYYNEIDPYAAQWLRNLIAAGHIAPGDVDERSIADVSPVDLIGYRQCHFFAGIGVWSHALRAAGWPDERPVWTGSCPCQPFSAAGKGEGTDDARHLWPEWFRLIREHRPVAVFGEQVSAAIRHGWLDLVSADLEGAGYAVGSAVLGAHSVGAPHIRQRLYFVAESEGKRHERAGAARGWWDGSKDGEPACGLAHAQRRAAERHGFALDGAPGGAQGQAHERQRLRDDAGHGLDFGVALGDTHDAGSQGRRLLGATEGRDGGDEQPSRPTGSSFWSACDWLPCIDGKARPVEPIAQQMVNGASESLGRLRPGAIEEITKEVASAYQTEDDARKAVFALRKAIATKAMEQRGVGRFHGVWQAPILFAFMLQLQEQGWALSQGLPRSGKKAAWDELRGVRHDETASCPSCQRGLDEQRPVECSNPVHLLSSILARHAQANWGEAIDKNAAAVFPLIVGATSRVGRLRAYGNAINAEAAAAFVRAYQEGA